VSWKSVELGELLAPFKAAIVSGPFGSNIGSKFFVEEGVPVIRGNNLSKDATKFIDDGFVYLTEQKASEFTNCVALPDDIIFTAAGSIGQVGIIPRETRYERYIISNKQIRARFDCDKILPLFAYYWLSSPLMVRHIESQNNGGAVPLLNLGLIRRLPVPVPPLAAQLRIGDILSAYDDLIENNQRRIALLEEAARMLYREWFVHFRFPGHEHVKIIDGLPEAWERTTLGQVAQTNSESYGAKELPEQINYIEISSVTQGRIVSKTTLSSNEAPGRARRKARDGDVIWSNVRPNLRAHALVLHPDEADVFSTGFTVLSGNRVPFSWLYLFVTTENFVGHLVNHATGAGYPAVRPDDFERAAVVLPSEGLLKLFHEAAEPNFRLISKLDQQNRALAQARDLLLPRLMSGEIAV
jgi:type I restriction enzyme S subunit